MTAPISVGPVNVDAAKRAQLQKAASQLEGLFVRQLFAAMRETVPTDGIADGGAGEQMFTGLLDENMADTAPSQWSRGLTSQMTAQFDRRLHPAAPESQ